MPTKSKPMSVEAFNALPKRTKAILVASDALAQLRIGIWKARSMSYIDAEDISNLTSHQKVSTASKLGRKILKETPCEICAKGCLMLSSVINSNKMNLGELLPVINDTGHGSSEYGEYANKAIVKKLCKDDNIFSAKNLNLIEQAFEGRLCWEGEMDEKDTPSYTEQNGADEFYGLYLDNDEPCTGYEDDTIRLAAILMNIVKNKGVFNPSKNNPSIPDVIKALAPPKKKAKKKPLDKQKPVV